jgi:hypothetical protein
MTQAKKLYAKGETVFTHIGSGLWASTLYGKDVMLERVTHNKWRCVDEETNKTIGDGKNRNQAMREAFYCLAEKHGYDAKEAARIDWILVPQPYRSYGGHKPRGQSTTKNSLRDNSRKIVATKKTEDEKPKITEVAEVAEVEQTTDDQFDHYKFAYNEKLGGWFYFNEGDVLDASLEKLHGPFKNEGEMLKDIIAH